MSHHIFGPDGPKSCILAALWVVMLVALFAGVFGWVVWYIVREGMFE